MCACWGRTAPWAWQIDGELGLVDWRSVAPDDWVRIVPEALELASVRCKWRHDEAVSLINREMIVDRKLVPDADVLYDVGAEFVCSARFLETLDALAVTDVVAQPVTHINARRGRGPALYRVAVHGSFDAFAADQSFDVGDPIPPVRFDATHGKGGLMRRSPPLGPRRNWLAFCARGTLVQAFHRRHPDAALLLQAVDLIGEPPAYSSGTSLSWMRDADPEAPRSVADSCADLLAHRDALGHVLPPPADEEALASARQRLALPPTSTLLAFLRQSDGPVLHRGAIAFFAAAKRSEEAAAALAFEAETLERENTTDTMASSGLCPPAGICLFARSHDGEVFWGIDSDDRVYGFGRGDPIHGGFRYGSGLPFADWLADTIADLG